MKIEDFQKTGGNRTRIVAGWEVKLDDVVQPVSQKYASEVNKIGNILIQFPIDPVKIEKLFICRHNRRYAL
jgi:hypothetical protein